MPELLPKDEKQLERFRKWKETEEAKAHRDRLAQEKAAQKQDENDSNKSDSSK